MEAGFDVDIYLAGHTHRKHAHKESLLTLSDYGKEPKLIERSKVVARCGAFLKGFHDDHPSVTMRHAPSYAEEKLLRPTDLGWLEITVRWKFVGTGRDQVTVPDYRLAY